MKKYLLFCLSGLMVALNGCGGGTDSGTGSTSVTGLDVASQVSVVEPQTVTTSPSISALPKSVISKGIGRLVSKAITTDTSGAYYTDPLNTYVHDGSMEALDIINEILCSIDQTKHEGMVNEGNYIAMIDNGLCDKDANQQSNQGNQSSGATNGEDLETWVVNSSRTNATADQIVKVWIAQKGSTYEPAMEIQAKMTIKKGASDKYPYGLFRIDFKMVDPSNIATTMAEGYLETVERTDTQVEIQFSMDGASSFNVSEVAHVLTNLAGTTGYGYTSHSFDFEGFDESKTFNVAFNENYYQTDDGSETQCLDRKNYDGRVFRYGVYKEDGSRLTISNPGFSIKLGNEYGWAGYWGLWFSESVTLVGGETVTRSNNDGVSATYTTVITPGKLIRHTKTTLTLDDIRGDFLNYWDSQNGRNIRVVWDGSSLLQHSTESFGSNGTRTWTAITGTPPLPLTANQWMSFWRDGLGSIYLVVPSNGQVTGSTTATSDTQQVMTAAHSDFANGALTLNCFNNCPRGNITQAQYNWVSGATPYLTDSIDVNAPNVYTIDPADMTLKVGGVAAKPADGVTAISGSPNSWGIHSGAMLTSTVGLTNPWDVWSQTTYYSWETGTNSWNKFMGLKNSSGTAVTFDPPAFLNYTHTATGDKYVLDYSGFGELHGIPWEQDAEGRWYPLTTIPDGSSVTSGSTTYYVRALDMEQSMRTVDAGSCSGLSFQTLTVPEAVYVDPSIGTKPTVTDDPKVIKGEIL